MLYKVLIVAFVFVVIFYINLAAAVKPDKPTLLFEPQAKTIGEGTGIKLTCQTTNTWTVNIYTFRRGSSQINRGSANTFSIEHANSTHTGSYTCMVTIDSEDSEPSDAYTVTVTVDCPGEFVAFGQKCYKFLYQDLKFEEAVEECQTLAAFIAEPKSEDEDAFLTKLIHSQSPSYCGVWLGATDETEEKTWMWKNSATDVAAGFTKFTEADEPGDNTKRNCLYKHKTLNWIDGYCTAPGQVICERPFSASSVGSANADERSNAVQTRHASVVELLIGAILTWTVGHVASGHGQ